MPPRGGTQQRRRCGGLFPGLLLAALFAVCASGELRAAGRVELPVADCRVFRFTGGKLFLYQPGPGFEGVLNPTNPPTERMKVMTPIDGPR